MLLPIYLLGGVSAGIMQIVRDVDAAVAMLLMVTYVPAIPMWPFEVFYRLRA